MQMNYTHPQLVAARKTNAKYKNTIATFVSILRLYVVVMLIATPIALHKSNKDTAKTAVKQSQSIVNR